MNFDISSLYEQRANAVRAANLAMDQACSVNGEGLMSSADVAARAACGDLWALDDRIMAVPATSVAELAIKAKLVQSRFVEGEGYHDEFVARLLTDIERLAVN